MASSLPPALAPHPELAAVIGEYDTHDVKTAEGRKGLREFLAAFFGYAPAWLRLGVAVRQAVARVTGVTLPPLVMGKAIAPADIPFAPGAAFVFFTVLAAKEGAYWVVRAQDAHIQATMAVVRRPLGRPPTDGAARFHVATFVRYLSWRGRLYYAAILPAHHLGLSALTAAGAR